MFDPRLARPSSADLEEIAEAALASIPTRLREMVRGVVIRVEEFPDDATVEEMELDSPFDLLGLYHGVSLLERSESAPRQDLDMIFLYRRPLLDHWCESGEPLATLVRHVLIHEIGHHFGFSDAEMAAIEAGP
ncbi:MAG: metallopeptidase family protein [Alphaproteobacteria bacterium]|nr:metallopeptidase family protein [Alphaproteobacteria bacterium]